MQNRIFEGSLMETETATPNGFTDMKLLNSTQCIEFGLNDLEQSIPWTTITTKRLRIAFAHELDLVTFELLELSLDIIWVAIDDIFLFKRDVIATIPAIEFHPNRNHQIGHLGRCQLLIIRLGHDQPICAN